MTTLTVGQGQQYKTIAAAVAASHDGDVLKVQAGTYTNDFAEIKTKITLQGVGGMVHMVATGSLPNDKGILVTNTDVTIDHFEFSGAKGSSGNGAGIRYQGGNLVLTNSYFHDNQNGLLSNPSPNGTITIRNSEFGHNGAGDGYTHNLYVGDIAKLTIADSYFHDAVVGHEIKSRAAQTEITNTRIIDGSGSSSYSVDLPNGGKAVLTGNTIQQGANGGNPAIVAFGEEGGLHANSSLTMTGNTVLNDMSKGTLVWDASGSPAKIDGTRVWNLGDGQMASGSGATVTNTTHLSSEPGLDASHPWSATSPTPPTTPPTTPTPPPPTTPVPPTSGITWSGTSLADSKSGGAGNDHFYGAAGNDTLKGLGGADRLEGGAGADKLIGGAGNDYLIGGGENDIYVMERGGGKDTVQGFASHSGSYTERDHFDVSALGVTKANFASAVHISDSAQGALISVGDTQVTVLGMHASSFNASDFLFA